MFLCSYRFNTKRPKGILRTAISFARQETMDEIKKLNLINRKRTQFLIRVLDKTNKEFMDGQNKL